MESVDRFIRELTDLFESDLTQDDLKMHTKQRLMSFIGRVAALDENGYAPVEDVVPTLREGRGRLSKLPLEGTNIVIRMELLKELDQTIALMNPARFPLSVI